jgi:hypothetical protein
LHKQHKVERLAEHEVKVASAYETGLTYTKPLSGEQKGKLAVSRPARTSKTRVCSVPIKQAREFYFKSSKELRYFIIEFGYPNTHPRAML